MTEQKMDAPKTKLTERAAAALAQVLLKRWSVFAQARKLEPGEMLYVIALALSLMPAGVRKQFDKLYDLCCAQVDEMRNPPAQNTREKAR